MSEDIQWCENRLDCLNCTPSDIDQICKELREGGIEQICSGFTKPILSFKTKWVAPHSLINKISKNYPTITFLLSGSVENEFITKTVHKDGTLQNIEELKISDRDKSIIFKEYLCSI
jgi:Api92-like protein with ferredoxin domain